jgi:hypothetical protein
MGQFLPFAEWLPDLPAFENPGATVAKNVVPDAKSYRSFPNPTLYSTSLGGVCKGALVARDLSGNYFNYAGDTSALYSLSNLAWTSVSRLAGGSYTTPSDDYWEFTQFGNQVIAVNGANGDVPQAITVGAANFAALSGGPPRAKHIASVRDFVVLGNISASATSPQMVRWCAINNVGSWTPDAATLADFQDLPGDGGWVQKIVGGEYGVVFQERAIYRMTFVGGGLVFQFDKVQTNLGAWAPQAVVSYRNFCFFLAEDGFYMFDGSTVKPIGQNKVDRTFFNELDTNYVYRIHAAIDPVRKLVAWAYPASGNTNGNPNHILIYNWGVNRWSRIEDLSIELLFRNSTAAGSLDGLDTLYPNLDLLLISLDDAQWSGGNYTFGYFNGNHRLATFNGSSMPATVETAEYQFNRQNDGLAYVTELRPVAEGLSASVTVALGTRMTSTEPVTYSNAVQPGSSGFASVRSTSRFHRMRLTTSNNSSFDHLQGIDVTATEDGRR